jgi:hypothetical protein
MTDETPNTMVFQCMRPHAIPWHAAPQVATSARAAVSAHTRGRTTTCAHAAMYRSEALWWCSSRRMWSQAAVSTGAQAAAACDAALGCWGQLGADASEVAESPSGPGLGRTGGMMQMPFTS